MIVLFLVSLFAPFVFGKNVRITEKWTNGYKGECTVTVNKDVQDWRLTIKFNHRVDSFSGWNGKVVSKEGQTIVMSPETYNSVRKQGEKVSVGFVVSGGESGASCSLSGQGGGTGVNTKPPGHTLPPGVTEGPVPPKGNGKYDYCDVLKKSIMFYEAERSGKMPSNNRIKYRHDSAMGDKGNNGEDLTGGWYDAGDHVKFGLPMAWATTTLIWGLIEYKSSYENCGQLKWMLESVKWPLDWFVKAHTKSNELYVQVGDGNADHGFWGRPEDMKMHRPAYKITPSNPGSDVAGEYAAALAAGSIAFKSVDGGYSAKILEHAKTIFQFAESSKGKYTAEGRIPASPFYVSQTYTDDLAMAAIWLHRATGDKTYLNKAIGYAGGSAGWAYSWDEQTAAVNLLLYQLTKDGVRKQYFENYMRDWMPGGGVHYTPKGLAWRIEWGANRYAANSAFLALRASDIGLNSGSYFKWAEGQIGYMLGDSGRSYVVGFGHNPPQRPHHRSSSCPSNGHCGSGQGSSGAPNPQVLYGALVGGPGRNDDYQDSRTDYVKNEVATDYNAGFQSAIAALRSHVK